MNHKDTSFSGKFWNFNLYLKINFFNCPRFNRIIAQDSRPVIIIRQWPFQQLHCRRVLNGLEKERDKEKVPF